MSHSAAGDGISHPIDLAEFVRLVEERLSQNPYRDCKALQQAGKVGAIGRLFKIELPPYGYAFVAKGTFPWVFDMMLMSWGGEFAAEAGLPNLSAEGVNHGDEREANML
ncbi:hypothetical protein CDD81_7702 [Ophiocordyceps australis]|uniref:Uncharacterized protein n=1 Tax=Ophiocordyceps australis TaxID=1399860 RepID=A0A2C5Y2T1_9HYPO|nr:hypothetical protein CDD81_7702 [Ophiocordyceps australis]